MLCSVCIGMFAGKAGGIILPELFKFSFVYRFAYPSRELVVEIQIVLHCEPASELLFGFEKVPDIAP